MNTINIQEIHDAIKNGLLRDIAKLDKLALASLRLSDNYAQDVYLGSQKKMADELGVEYRRIDIPAHTSLNDVCARITRLNDDKGVTGIIVNKPLADSWSEEAVFSAIAPTKDVEGMHPCNIGKSFYAASRAGGGRFLCSPTVCAVMEVIDRLGIELYAKEVVLVGFSNIIGKPLAVILGSRMATVTITHIATFESQKLPAYIAGADIVISAAGRPHLIKGNWLKEGSVVIDVGIGQKDGKLVGDVEYASAVGRAAFVSPVPGGIGKLTTLLLFRNLLYAAQLQL